MPDQSSITHHGAIERIQSSAGGGVAEEPSAPRAKRDEQRRMFALTATTCLSTVLAGWIGHGFGLLPAEIALGLSLVAYVTGYPDRGRQRPTVTGGTADRAMIVRGDGRACRMAPGEQGNNEGRTEEGTLELADGAIVPFRPIRPDDAAALQAFHAGLSVQSVYFRFFGVVLKLTAERARSFTDLDGTNRFALVALDPAKPETIIAVVRYDREAGTDRSEYAAIVTDRWQGRGLGLALTRRLIAAARRRGVHHLYAIVLPENNRMLHLFRDLHLPEHARFQDGSVRVELDLPSTDGECAESLPDVL